MAITQEKLVALVNDQRQVQALECPVGCAAVLVSDLLGAALDWAIRI